MNEGRESIVRTLINVILLIPAAVTFIREKRNGGNNKDDTLNTKT